PRSVKSDKGPSIHWLTIKALLFFLLLDMGLKLFGFAKVYELITGRKTKIRPVYRGRDHDQETVNRVGAAVAKATRYYYRKRIDCLPKSLTIFFLLVSEGIKVDLCFGVELYPFSAHAWVEYQGEVIGDVPQIKKQYTLINKG